ncbi:MAG TPA: hypothetical protein VN253_00565 [Kofleriaceae bacterium]|nr:hypothetical protein [Kofleriaceae bacterium]
MRETARQEAERDHPLGFCRPFALPDDSRIRARIRGVRGRRCGSFPTSEIANDVARRDDPHEAPLVGDDRHAMDLLRRHQLDRDRYRARRLQLERDRRHQLEDGRQLGLAMESPREVLGRALLAGVSSIVELAYDVGHRDEPNQPAIVVDDRDARQVALEQELLECVDAEILEYTGDAPGHHLAQRDAGEVSGGGTRGFTVIVHVS